MFKRCVVIVAAVLLTGCGTPKLRQPAGHAPLAGAAIPQPPGGPGVYGIDPAQSELRLLVYRAGAMARLGHNHVIVNRAVGGWIKFTGNPTAAAFAIAIPVAGFLVDNAGARSQEGTDFFEEVTEEAREGTRHNMLSAALLDGDHYPLITLTSVSVTETSGAMTAKLAVSIAGHESMLVVPFQVATSAGQVSASGSIRLRQTSLGLTPFSVMLGALQVQDELTVKFTLVATVT